jgi:hypothetical protein
MYTAEDGITVGPVLYADDNLTPLALNSAEQIQPILGIYDQYTGVSGLNINVQKSTALCINTSREIEEGLTQAGLAVSLTTKHLGIHLAKTIEATIKATMEATDPRAIKRRILATTPPTDILHQALLINMALIPIYNHVLIALPVGEPYIDELQKEILKFLWTRQHEGQSKQKRRLVTKCVLGQVSKWGVLASNLLRTLYRAFSKTLYKKYIKKQTCLGLTPYFRAY